MKASSFALFPFAVLGFLLAGAAAPPVDGARVALVAALRQGGNVLVIRHANSPAALPDEKTADPENAKRERQLDAAGRESAVAMGRALRTLGIPVGEVLVSPAYRTRQTAQLAQLANPKLRDELAFEGEAMTELVTPAQSAWLKARSVDLPRGTNTFIITHSPNLAQAFPEIAPALAAGEAAVFGSDGRGGSRLLGRIRIEEWPALR